MLNKSSSGDVLPRAVEDFLDALTGMPPKNPSHCPYCKSALVYKGTAFFLAVGNKGWNITLPVCKRCGSTAHRHFR
jgi:hypothetical protein